MAEGGCIVDYHGCDFFPERCVTLCGQGLVLAGKAARTSCMLQGHTSSAHNLIETV